MKTIKELQEIVDKKMEETLHELYQKENIKTGDIPPFMLMKWEEFTLGFARLFESLIEGNRPLKSGEKV